MTRQEFIDEAKRRGKNKEEIRAKFEQLDSSGAFDDSPTTEPAEPQATTVPQRGGSSGDFGESFATKIGRYVMPTQYNEPASVKSVGIGALEALGLPMRALGALRTDPKTGRKYKIDDPESNIIRPEMEKAKAGLKYDLPQPPMGQYGGTLPRTEEQEAEALRKQRAVDEMGIEVAGGMAGDPTTYIAPIKGALTKTGVGKALTGAATKVVELPNKVLGKLAQELSGVSEEALRMAKPFSRGAEELKRAAGTQKIIGEKILETLDDFERFLPERQAIENSLTAMEPIKTEKIISKLKAAKPNSKLTPLKIVDDKIDQLIDDLSGMSKDGRIPAKEAFRLRKDFDDIIGDAWGKESNKYINAVKQARYSIKDELIESAKFSGKQEYVDAMKTLAKKEAIAEKLKGYVGKSAQVRERKVEQFVNTLFGKNKTDRQQTIKDLGEMFGEDFLRESKIASLAAELGEKGTPSILPTQTTGRSLLGTLLSKVTKGATAPVSSPLIASKVTLPLAEGSEYLAKKIVGGTAKVAESLGELRGAGGAVQGVLDKIREEEEEKKRKARGY